MFSGCVEELVCRERHWSSVEDAAGGVDEGNDENELERVDDVIAELGCGDVKAEENSQGKAEDRSAAEDGVDADEKADGDAPSKFFWGCSHTEEGENGKGDPAIKPVVVDSGGLLDRDVAI